MSLDHIGIVCKTSTLENLQVMKLWDKMQAQNFSLVERIRLSHNKHETSIQNLKRLLESENIRYTFFGREDIFPANHNIDLLMSLGGDGTFIHCAQYNINIPLLGINSAPGESIGHYCKFSVLNDAAKLQKFLRHLKTKIIEPQKIDRLEAYIDFKAIEVPVLNDILITEVNPAAICSYLIRYEDETEWHKSSGVWVSTNNGSTAAYHSAGGKQFGLYNQDKKKQYAFFVRELYGNQHCLRNKLVSEDDQFQITSNMPSGAIYIDGFKTKFNFLPMSTLHFKFHKKPLLAYL